MYNRYNGRQEDRYRRRVASFLPLPRFGRQASVNK